MGLVSLAWHFLTLCCVVTEGGGEPLQHEETKRRGVFHSHCETALLLDCCYVFSSFLAAISKISLSQKYSRQVSWYGERAPVGTFRIPLEGKAQEAQGST